MNQKRGKRESRTGKNLVPSLVASILFLTPRSARVLIVHQLGFVGNFPADSGVAFPLQVSGNPHFDLRMKAYRG